MDNEKYEQYLKSVEAVMEAARKWVIAHPDVALAFSDPPEDAMLIADVRACMAWWPQDDDARDFLRTLDEAAGPAGCTFLMAKVARDGLCYPLQPAQGPDN